MRLASGVFLRFDGAMLFDSRRLLLIAGPCLLESEDLAREVARTVADLASSRPELQLVFKGSFDKANRTRLSSPRGPGLEAGLAILAKVKGDTGLPVLTDFHLPEQASPVGEVCDVLQVPAFLCRQTDMLVAAAQTGRVVNVKKGQFLSPNEVPYITEKLAEAKAAEVWLTERGSFFGYQNLVVDMRSFSQLSGLGHPVIMDATHSVQQPGAAGGQSGGRREFIAPLALAALAAGANGLFLETHPDPANALSDGPSQLPLDELPGLVDRALRLWQAARP